MTNILQCLNSLKTGLSNHLANQNTRTMQTSANKYSAAARLCKFLKKHQTREWLWVIDQWLPAVSLQKYTGCEVQAESTQQEMLQKDGHLEMLLGPANSSYI